MNQSKTILLALQEAKQILKENKIESYALDAQLLLMHSIGFSKIELFTKDTFLLTKQQEQNYNQLIQKRVQGMPTQYLLGHCEFMGLPFIVKEGVLIPRPDTEILVETVLEICKRKKFQTIMDMCTGTGCIAVSIAYYTDINKIYGIDISACALDVAKKNAASNHVEITFLESNLFESVPIELVHQMDAVVSNPPYIPEKEINKLMKEVREYEPHLALNGGKDGLSFYRKIIEDSKQYLKKGGYLFFEIGYNQGKEVSSLLLKKEFTNIEIRQDLAGLDRVVFGQLI